MCRRTAHSRAAGGSRSRRDRAVALQAAEARPVFIARGGRAVGARGVSLGGGAFRELLRERDVVLVDQRGTGGSHPIECRPPGNAERPGPWTSRIRGRPSPRRDASGARCRPALLHHQRCGARPRGRARRDRGAAGQPRRISYGTRVALEYLRREPGRVCTVVLDGIVPPELALGSEHARNLESALDQHFRALRADARPAVNSSARRATARCAARRAARVATTGALPRSAHRRDARGRADGRIGRGRLRLYAYAPPARRDAAANARGSRGGPSRSADGAGAHDREPHRRADRARPAALGELRRGRDRLRWTRPTPARSWAPSSSRPCSPSARCGRAPASRRLQCAGGGATGRAAAVRRARP